MPTWKTIRKPKAETRSQSRKYLRSPIRNPLPCFARGDARQMGSKACRFLQSRRNCRIWDAYAVFGKGGVGAFSSARHEEGAVPVTSRKPRLNVFTDW